MHFGLCWTAVLLCAISALHLNAVIGFMSVSSCVSSCESDIKVEISIILSSIYWCVSLRYHTEETAVDDNMTNVTYFIFSQVLPTSLVLQFVDILLSAAPACHQHLLTLGEMCNLLTEFSPHNVILHDKLIILHDKLIMNVTL